MATQPTIAKGYRIFYAPYAENMPTFNSDVWIEVTDTFVSLPNFFPTGDSIDTTTLDKVMKTSIEGMAGAENYVCNCHYTDQLAAMHYQMVSDKYEPGKGYSWLKFEFTNRQIAVIGKFTSVLYLPTPEVSAGELDDIDFTLFSQGHEYIQYTNSLVILNLTSVAGETEGQTKISVDRACPSNLIAKWTTDTTIAIPEYDDIASPADYEPFVNNWEYPATTGNEIAVAYIEPSTHKIKYFGKTEVVSKDD